MDPASITLGMVAAKLLSGALDEMGSELGGVPARLMTWVRKRLGSGGELQRVEDAPDSPRRVKELGSALDALLDQDPHARDELERLIADLKRDQPATYQSVVGNQNVIANQSTVTVNYGQQSSPQPREVRWQLRHRTGSEFELVNAGSATALNVSLNESGSVVRLDVTSGGQDVGPDESIVFVAIEAWGGSENGPDGVVINWAEGDPTSQKETLRPLPPKR